MWHSPFLPVSCAAALAYPTWSCASCLWPDVSHKWYITAENSSPKPSYHFIQPQFPCLRPPFISFACAAAGELGSDILREHLPCPLPKPTDISEPRGTGTGHWAGSRCGLHGRPRSACLFLWVETWKSLGACEVSVLGRSQPLWKRGSKATLSPMAFPFHFTTPGYGKAQAAWTAGWWGLIFIPSPSSRKFPSNITDYSE